MKRPTKIPPLRIRQGTTDDVSTIISMIRGLAKYERLVPHLRLSAKRLHRDGFGKHRRFGSLICTRYEKPVGYAAYYFAYSTFTCGPVLFVEDIFVLPEERGKGPGRALMKALARFAVRKGCDQMEWLVLDWNRPSIKFYEGLGARLDRTWVLTRLTGANLRRLASK
ncbi:MAG TPA: GNAT family N-acetyltransferase [Candidatus Acidoferrum sp.]|nr:GNAT family N-acetyltransferase [Candidatus Acidoferrum sp.]